MKPGLDDILLEVQDTRLPSYPMRPDFNSCSKNEKTYIGL